MFIKAVGAGGGGGGGGGGGPKRGAGGGGGGGGWSDPFPPFLVNAHSVTLEPLLWDVLKDFFFFFFPNEGRTLKVHLNRD